MSFLSKINVLKTIRIAAVFFLFLTFYFILVKFITNPSVKEFAMEHKVLGVLIIICYVVLSHVFAPIAGSPGTILSVGLYGVWTTVGILYCASMISANINFWISRKYGREIVMKFVGVRTMKEIDHFVEASEVKLLVISRLFGFALFDIISYSFGLTSIHYRVYMLVTLVVGIIPGLTVALLFNDVDFSSSRNITLWLVWVVIAGSVFAYFIKRLIKKRKRDQITEE